MSTTTLSYTAFEDTKLIICGSLDEVALKIKKRLKLKPSASILIFSDSTGKEMDLDLRGSEAEILDRLKVFITTSMHEQPVSTGPGRPKLGVVPREVSLLPRHWEWLATQSGGASSTLRRLVDEARKNSSAKEQTKESQERTHKFMTALAGDLKNYEEALRALYAKDKKAFFSFIKEWPDDIKEYIKKLSTETWT